MDHIFNSYKLESNLNFGNHNCDPVVTSLPLRDIRIDDTLKPDDNSCSSPTTPSDKHILPPDNITTFDQVTENVTKNLSDTDLKGEITDDIEQLAVQILDIQGQIDNLATKRRELTRQMNISKDRLTRMMAEHHIEVIQKNGISFALGNGNKAKNNTKKNTKIAKK